MKILVLNCGSSSIKYQLIEMSGDPVLLAKGLLERIGLKCSVLKHQPKDKPEFKHVEDVENHQQGINLILEALMHPEHGVIKDKYEINAVGHRVAHGGENFDDSVVIDDFVRNDIERLCALAPLHNPANLKGIDSMAAILPGIKQVAVFDTSFHSKMPNYAYMYAIPYEYYEKYKVRRYGFHGTSHKFVAAKACEQLGLKMSDINIITCHLGNGASVAAIQKGRSVDTSMGFTPVEGLPMGTRCGDLDLGVLLYLMEKENLDLKAANNLINKLSGMNGVSGVSFDMRDLHKAKDEGNQRAALALDIYVYRVKKYIGAYAAAMGGVDLIIFTGGIGENDDWVREQSCKGLEFMGVEFDPQVNSGLRGKDALLSKPNSKVKVMCITTNEELVIAMDTKRLIYG